MYVIVRKMNLSVLWIRIWSDPDPVRWSDPDPKPDRTFLIYKTLRLSNLSLKRGEFVFDYIQ